MGIMVTKNDNNEKLAKDIRSSIRSKNSSALEVNDKDFVDSSEYLKETEKAGKFSWIWAVLIGLAIISLFIIIFI